MQIKHFLVHLSSKAQFSFPFVWLFFDKLRVEEKKKKFGIIYFDSSNNATQNELNGFNGTEREGN